MCEIIALAMLFIHVAAAYVLEFWMRCVHAPWGLLLRQYCWRGCACKLVVARAIGIPMAGGSQRIWPSSQDVVCVACLAG